MKIFFPDSKDSIDPRFDFVNETHQEGRIPQRDDYYIFEVYKDPVIDGLLIAKSSVDGTTTKSGKYSLPQRHRLLRNGAKDYFRLTGNKAKVEIMGDCGAFAYVNEEIPPYSCEEVLNFYSDIGVDYGIAPDHIIFEYANNGILKPEILKKVHSRKTLSINLAKEFFELHKKRKLSFLPMGVAHGWDPKSYADSVKQLQSIGYTYIAMGGMVPLKTFQVIDVLNEVDNIREPNTKLHLLGLSRIEHAQSFTNHGVISIDSTAPLMKAFKDDSENYWTLEDAYTAIRIPQIDENNMAKRMVASGMISQNSAKTLEKSCLEAMRIYAEQDNGIEELINKIKEYGTLLGLNDKYFKKCERTLLERPWEKCDCDICRKIGYHIVLFRGAERNRRRGFHNLWIMKKRLNANIKNEL